MLANCNMAWTLVSRRTQGVSNVHGSATQTQAAGGRRSASESFSQQQAALVNPMAQLMHAPLLHMNTRMDMDSSVIPR
jgi:hypothetical protein